MTSGMSPLRPTTDINMFIMIMSSSNSSSSSRSMSPLRPEHIMKGYDTYC